MAGGIGDIVGFAVGRVAVGGGGGGAANGIANELTPPYFGTEISNVCLPPGGW